MINTRDIIWLAAILEGEGSFSLTGRIPAPAIKLKMTDVDIIERFRSIVDPSKSYAITIEQKENYKTAYIITLNGTRAVGWMMTIYPLMGLRRKKKIRELLLLWKSYKNSRTVGDIKQRSLSRRLQAMGYSDVEIRMAKLISHREDLTDQQILKRLEDLKTDPTVN